MYVTRPLSMYKKDPTALFLSPPKGPNSGYLVILDEEAESYCCFGMCKDSTINHLPFPQNKDLTVTYTTSNGRSRTRYRDKVIFIPVLNQPLSANRYYVIQRRGKHQGEASTSSKEEEMGTCFCCNYIKDVTPRPLDPFNMYQQFEITKKHSGFGVINEDGFPPEFLRRKGWHVGSKTPHNYHLGEALGINSSLRARLPDFNFPLSNDCSESVVVGKWYCPFMFVKEEGMGLKEQMKMSVFYEMTLEQRWVKIFSWESSNNSENSVVVDVVVQREVAKVAGRDGIWDEKNHADGILWFKSVDNMGMSIGLSLAIMERMRWEQERVGQGSGNGKEGKLERVFEFRGSQKCKKFGCYVLVESFVLKRMDGSLILTYDYRHTHKVKCKWE
ncbi:hypothetical protein L6164_001823 [Bauhinia variegata]|uniref:Uncharacterized protein n=1 Tax=Bauhinia variegata TaxID=167791 RepID=A0ACB9QBR6_BAUVA|nr:hypothetical protein L6164_001823 [Bauhinia variegata]